MSELGQELRRGRAAGVRIVHAADGTAVVNGVTVRPEAGQDVRDAAYLAAVRLVAGAAAPVAATRVEADGTEYPLMLYPLRDVHGAQGHGGQGHGAQGHDGHSTESADGGGTTDVAGRRASRLRMRPFPRGRRRAGAIAVCVVAAALAAAVFGQNDPALVRLTVDQAIEAAHVPLAQAAGRGMAEAAWRGMVAATAADAGTPASAVPSASPRAQEQPSGVAPGGAAARAAGMSPGALSAARAPGPRPEPRPAPARPLAVTGMTLTLVGGDKSAPNVAYVIMVSTNGPQPLTLTYSYSGSKRGVPVTGRVTLSGQTEYAVADEITAKPYCGGTITMHAATSPTAADGTVTATVLPAC